MGVTARADATRLCLAICACSTRAQQIDALLEGGGGDGHLASLRRDRSSGDQTRRSSGDQRKIAERFRDDNKEAGQVDIKLMMPQHLSEDNNEAGQMEFK